MSDNYTFWYYTPQGGAVDSLPSNILRFKCICMKFRN